MNITKYEHSIVIGIISVIIGIGIGGYFSQEVVVKKAPIKKVESVGLNPYQARKLAKSKLDDFGWTTTKEWACLNWMWGKESAWNYKAVSKTHDHGIPQRNMPTATKAEIHAFMTDPVKQINWGLGYIKSRYGSPCRAKAFWLTHHWY